MGFILVKCVLHFMSRLILKTHMAYELCYFPKRTNIHLLLIWTGTTTRFFFFKKNSNFAECRPEGTRQRIFFKKNQTLPSAGQGALPKEFLEKNKTSLPRAG